MTEAIILTIVLVLLMVGFKYSESKFWMNVVIVAGFVLLLLRIFALERQAAERRAWENINRVVYMKVRSEDRANLPEQNDTYNRLINLVDSIVEVQYDIVRARK